MIAVCKSREKYCPAFTDSRLRREKLCATFPAEVCNQGAFPQMHADFPADARRF